MATNLGNTRNTVETTLIPRCMTAAILEFFFRPQVPASRNKKANATVRTGARVSGASHPPAHVRVALAFSRLKKAKK